MMISSMTFKERNGLLTALWDDSSVMLLGVKDGVASSIDRNLAVVSFTDVEGVYKFGLGEVTALSGAKARVRRILFKQYGVTISRMRFEWFTNDIDCYRASRVGEER